jgi:hypothetical protein
VKYFLFFLMLVIGVPVMANLAQQQAKIRGMLGGGLFLFALLVKQGKINFMSMESYRGPDRGFEVCTADLIAIALFVVLKKKYPQKIVWLPPGSWLLLALYCIAFLSALGAENKIVAFFSLFKWARAYGIYWITYNALKLPWPRRSIWSGMVIAAWTLFLWALKDKYIGHVYRVAACFDHSNTVPLFINQFLPVLAMWGLTDKKLTNTQSLLTTIGCLGLCVTSQSSFSRLGMLLSVSGFFGSLIIANIFCRTKRVRGVTVLAVAGVFVGGMLALPSIMERIRTAPEESELARKEFNIAAKKMAEDHLFGVGVNNFSHALTKQARYSQFISVMEDEDEAGVCHHIYNLTAAELGKPGLYVFVTILAYFLLNALIGFWKNRYNMNGWLCMGVVIGQCALHVSGFAEWVFRITPVTYMYALMAGLAMGLKDGGGYDLMPLKKKPVKKLKTLEVEPCAV